MQNSTIGINFEKLDTVGRDIIEYAEKINRVLNDISEVNEKILKVLSYDDISKLKEKYELIKLNYSVIVDNILSYNNDFSNIKKKIVFAEDELKEITLKEVTKIDDNLSS